MQLGQSSSVLNLPDAPDRAPRLGLIGLGWVARNCHLPSLKILMEHGWKLRVTHLCDQDESRAAGFKADWPEAEICTDAAQVLDNGNLDGVLILTHPNSSAALLGSAIEKGKTVFVEKPVAHTRREIEVCSSAASARGVRVQVGYNRRYQPLAGEFMRLLREMTPPRHIKVKFWRAGRCEPGFFDDTLVHCLDFLSHLVGRLDVRNVQVWPVPANGGPLDHGWRIDLAADGGRQLTAEIDIRPSVGIDLETYQALGNKFSVTLQYPHLGTTDGQAALVVHSDGREHVVRQEKISDQDISRRCVHSGFVNQMADFVRLCADPAATPVCTLRDAGDVLRMRDDIAALRAGVPQAM